jgi:hypothetical protein
MHCMSWAMNCILQLAAIRLKVRPRATVNLDVGSANGMQYYYIKRVDRVQFHINLFARCPSPVSQGTFSKIRSPQAAKPRPVAQLLAVPLDEREREESKTYVQEGPSEVLDVQIGDACKPGETFVSVCKDGWTRLRTMQSATSEAKLSPRTLFHIYRD